MTNQKIFATLMATLLLGTGAQAQRPIGSVSTADANVGGMLETSGGTATILNNGTVTAHEQTAQVALARGGTVNVCATSSVHLSQSSAIDGGPLLLALDHGALEMKFLSNAGDAVLTPEMRIQPAKAAPLDLRIRVVSNGDTCIENRGSDAPVLTISDTFGESNYIVQPQQHVLFEHGDLKQVVDNESSPCGCPPAVVISVADGGVSGGAVAKPGSTVAADAHPFPEAASEGLTMPAPLKQPMGHVSTDLALTYNSAVPNQPAAETADAAPATASVAAASAAPAPVAAAVSAPAPTAAPAKPVVAQAPPPPPPPTDDLAHVFIRFYHWVFHRRS
jgi:hypothetical protein